MNEPRASVLLPIYNAENFLGEAIESVLKQTWTDFELLLLNDGSTDNSTKIIEKYCVQDKRCRHLAWENVGLVETLNRGIGAAKGGVLFRMDADDVCSSDRFEKQIQFLESNPNCVAVGSRVLLIDPDGMPILEMGAMASHEEIDAGNLSGVGSVMCHPAVAMRRDAAIKIGAYRAEYKHAEDVDFFLRMGEIGRLANMSQVLLKYRQHLGSIGYAHRALQVTSTFAAIAEARRRRGLASNDFQQNTVCDTASPTLVEVYRKWAWWALSAGNTTTARKYAKLALLNGIFDWHNWKLFACSIRGH